jgi:hypothetical protein
MINYAASDNAFIQRVRKEHTAACEHSDEELTVTSEEETAARSCN